MFRVNGFTLLKWAIFALRSVLQVPIALAFWTATIGFLLRVRGGDPLSLTRGLQGESPPDGLWPKTAVIMPAYNEDPARVFAGLKSTYENLRQTGLQAHFDFFLLSDTTDPDLWVREEVAFGELKAGVPDPARLHYRNRRDNLEHKTGNIADFCATWGGDYRYMIILDADSVMTGACLVSLVRLMEDHPEAGIVQAPPLPVNRRSLFGRLHQFALHAYGPVFMTGLNYWQGGSGNYWGHNAILRIRPFIEHCRLPRLPGHEPLGGSILSHDFVEAAFMRRAGWRVYLACDLEGSYEEMPSSLINYAARDRRWCQGNLQHARLLGTPGLHWVSRLHLGLGVMSYVSSPLWMLLLSLSTVAGLYDRLGRHAYFPSGRSLFPRWSVSVAPEAIMLFSIIMGFLVLPKLLSLLLLLSNSARAAEFGGRLKLALSVFLETLVSALLAPVLALLQTRFVLGILMGKKVTWESQERGEAGTTFREALRRHWGATLLGLAWGFLLWFTDRKLFWWFSPAILGMTLAMPMSVCTSRGSAGDWLKARGLLLTPAEVAPPEILQRLQQELERAVNRPWAIGRDGLAWVLEDRRVLDRHIALLPPPKPPDPLRRHFLRGLRLKLRRAGPKALDRQEKREFLLDPESIRVARRGLNGATPRPTHEP
jgi:membrane glycosyltransferase